MKKALYILVFIFSVGLFENISAWDNERTHRDLSGLAGDNSVLSKGKADHLKNLGFTEGLNQRFKWGGADKTAKEWLQDGSFLEDEGSNWQGFTGSARYTNHFHNPLKPWSAAGLTDLQSGESSVLWA